MPSSLAACDRVGNAIGESAAPTIEHVTYVDAPIEEVYRTLTTAEGWDSWFTDGTTLDTVPGGQIRLRWVDFGAERITAEDGGPVLEVETNRRLVFQWQPGTSPTTVSFDLERLGTGTRVRVRESGYAMDDVETAIACAAGWGEALTLLKFRLERSVAYGEVPAE